MFLTQTSAPATEPVTLAEAKAHLRVTTTDEDALITALIVAARAGAEAKTGRKLITQTWRATFDDFTDLKLLDLSPVASITSIKYDDAAGVEQTVGAADYTLIPTMPVLIAPAFGAAFPSSRSSTGAVRVTVVVGYGNAAAVPPMIKQWILAQVAALFENREAVADKQILDLGFIDHLLDTHKVYE